MEEPSSAKSSSPTRRSKTRSLLKSMKRASRSLSMTRRKKNGAAEGHVLLTGDDTNMLGVNDDDYHKKNDSDNDDDLLFHQKATPVVGLVGDTNNNKKSRDLDASFEKHSSRATPAVDSTPMVLDEIIVPVVVDKGPPAVVSTGGGASGGNYRRNPNESLGDYWARKEQEAQDSITNHDPFTTVGRRSPSKTSDSTNDPPRRSTFDAYHNDGDHGMRGLSVEPRHFYGLEDTMNKNNNNNDSDSDDENGRGKNNDSKYRSKSPTSRKSMSSSQMNSNHPTTTSTNTNMGMKTAPMERASSGLPKQKESAYLDSSDSDNDGLGDDDSSSLGLEIIPSHGNSSPTRDFEDHPAVVVPLDLFQVMEQCAWAGLYSLLNQLMQKRELVHATFTQKHPTNGATPLHIMVWKAPPSCTLLALQLLLKRKETTLLTMRDKDGNTPLHLFCANLEFHEQNEDEEELDQILLDCLELLVKMTPRLLIMPNNEGDTPVHLFCACPALCMKTQHEDKPLKEKRKIAIKNILLNNHPNCSTEEICSVKDSSGATPLHVAIAHAVDDALILKLLRIGGSRLLHMEDERGMIPLHYAAAFVHTSHGVVAKMIELYPESLFHKTHNKDTPMHLLVSNACQKTSQISTSTAFNGKLDRNTVKVVELLLGKSARFSAYPHEDDLDSSNYNNVSDSKLKKCPLLMTNREKLTPLHCCALFDVSPQLTRLIMKHPLAKRATSMTNSFGATPLHLAAAQPGVATSVATVVAIGTHEAASVQDRLKRTPLHVASQNIHATSILIKSLIQLYPEAVAEKTQRGHLPLHLAAQSQAKEPVIRALLKAYPKGAEAKNKSSNTPLHDAAKYRATIDVVRLLLDSYPEAVYIQNQYGNLPLHCATAYQAPNNVVTALLQVWPDAASMQNRNQDSPLHYAAAYATNSKSLEALIVAAPSSVLLLNSSGQSPIDRAKANNAPDDIIQYLEQSARQWSVNAAKDGWGTFTHNTNDSFDDGFRPF